jgi:hypothetical protein
LNSHQLAKQLGLGRYFPTAFNRNIALAQQLTQHNDVQEENEEQVE